LTPRATTFSKTPRPPAQKRPPRPPQMAPRKPHRPYLNSLCRAFGDGADFLCPSCLCGTGPMLRRLRPRARRPSSSQARAPSQATLSHGGACAAQAHTLLSSQLIHTLCWLILIPKPLHNLRSFSLPRLLLTDPALAPLSPPWEGTSWRARACTRASPTSSTPS
jgi:hypothetical protein